MDLQLLSLLLVVGALLVWRAVNRERREYARFRKLRATASRQKVMRRWLVESVLVFGGLTAAVLLGVWDRVPTVLRAAQEWTPIAASRDFFLETPIGPWIAAGAGIVGAVALVLPFLLLRGTTVEEVPKLGDVGALIPRTRGELPYGVGLGLSAGIFEETLFRFALPALLFGVGLGAPLAFGLAALLFGALHLYQKWVGVLVATLLGIVFSYLYLVSGSILLPIVVHVLIDLRSLVLLPLILGKVWSKAA